MSGRSDKVFRLVRGTARYVLSVVWVASGVAKLAGFSNFQDVLRLHGVLGERAVSLVWIVPGVEVVVGGVIFVAGSKAELVAWTRWAAAASVALLTMFCIYISQVPEETFKTVGCGCHGALGLTDIIGYPSRAAAIGFNAVLIGLSLSLLISRGGPKQTAPRGGAVV